MALFLLFAQINSKLISYFQNEMQILIWWSKNVINPFYFSSLNNLLTRWSKVPFIQNDF